MEQKLFNELYENMKSILIDNKCKYSNEVDINLRIFIKCGSFREVSGIKMFLDKVYDKVDKNIVSLSHARYVNILKSVNEAR